MNTSIFQAMKLFVRVLDLGSISKAPYADSSASA